MAFFNFRFINLLVVGVIFTSVLCQDDFQCSDTCKFQIVETIPEGMPPSEHTTTHQSWVQLIDMAQERIEIASYYWTLRDEASPPHPTSNNGTDIIDRLIAVGSRTENKINIQIVKHIDTDSFPNLDTKELVEKNAAEVRDLDVTKLIGAGILHTKMIIVDRKHLYLGSANLDWRALTQVKEIGILATNCSCLAQDMGKTFDVYWALAENNDAVPDQWEETFESPYNSSSPMHVASDGIAYDAFVSSAPPQFCPNGRTEDLDAIYHVMDMAEEFIHIAVMDYFPLIMFDGPLKYWGDIDNYLRNAALRQIKVKLLMAKWKQTRASAEMFLKSLAKVKDSYPNVDIQVKMFEVPADEDQAQIPFSRVNHNKYCVTDKSVHIGTSNWSGDYFISSGGVGFVAIPRNNSATQNDIRKQVADVFARDWNSAYSKNLEEIWPEEVCPTSPPTSTTLTQTTSDPISATTDSGTKWLSYSLFVNSFTIIILLTRTFL